MSSLTITYLLQCKHILINITTNESSKKINCFRSSSAYFIMTRRRDISSRYAQKKREKEKKREATVLHTYRVKTGRSPFQKKITRRYMRSHAIRISSGRVSTLKYIGARKRVKRLTNIGPRYKRDLAAITRDWMEVEKLASAVVLRPRHVTVTRHIRVCRPHICTNVSEHAYICARFLCEKDVLAALSTWSFYYYYTSNWI